MHAFVRSRGFSASTRTLLGLFLWPAVVWTLDVDPDLKLIQSDLNSISGALSTITKAELESIGLNSVSTSSNESNSIDEEDELLAERNGPWPTRSRRDFCGAAPK
eukprot:1177344-Prorocentrum_minimum.AAC.4